MRRANTFSTSQWSAALLLIVTALSSSRTFAAGPFDTPEKLIDYWTGVIARDPNNSQAYAQRAESWEKLQKVEKALDDVSAAIRIEPGNAEFYEKRASLLIPMESRRDEALADISKAVEIEPDNSDFRLMRMLVLLTQNRTDEALAETDQMLKAKPGDEHTMYWRAVLKLVVAFNNPTDGAAAQALDELAPVEQGSDAGHSLLMGAMILGLQEKFAEAVAVYTRYIDEHPHERDTHRVYGLRAEANRRLGKFAAAVADCTTSIELAPGEAMGYSQKAWLLATCEDEKVRDGKLAVDLAKRACELKGSTPGLQQILAAAYAECGQFDQAIDLQQKVVASFESPAASRTPPPGKFVAWSWPGTPDRKAMEDAKRQEAARYLESFRHHKPVREQTAAVTPSARPNRSAAASPTESITK